MKRPQLKTIAVLSLLMGLTALGLWGSSYWVPYGAQIMRRFTRDGRYVDRHFSFISDEGILQLRFEFENFPMNIMDPDFLARYANQNWTVLWDYQFRWPLSPSPRSSLLEWLGLRTMRETPGGGLQHAVVTVDLHYWFLVFASLLLPGLRWIGVWRRWCHRLAGLCTHCGYDLRATPDRCPECGKTASKNAAPT